MFERLIEPDDPDLLATVLAEVLRDPQLRQRMTASGVTRAREFSWTNTARSLRGAWHRALDHHEARRRA